jgi:predicted DNA-binding protein with PD1-like motif
MKRYLLPLVLFSISCHAAPQVVTPTTCNQLHKPAQPFMLILKKGEAIIPTLLACFTKANVQAASFTGIGAIEDPVIAYYDGQKKDYVDKKVNGMFELITLQGNITTLEKKPQLHIHVGIGDEHYQMLAGHLISATVGYTTELTVIPFSKPIIRHKDKDTGLNLISN